MLLLLLACSAQLDITHDRPTVPNEPPQPHKLELCPGCSWHHIPPPPGHPLWDCWEYQDGWGTTSIGGPACFDR